MKTENRRPKAEDRRQKTEDRLRQVDNWSLEKRFYARQNRNAARSGEARRADMRKSRPFSNESTRPGSIRLAETTDPPSVSELEMDGVVVTLPAGGRLHNP